MIRIDQESYSGECHGGPLDGDVRTEDTPSFVHAAVTVPPSPLVALTGAEVPPTSLAISRRVGLYLWHFKLLRWEWQGWENSA